MNIAINATILDEKPSGLGIYTLNVIKELSKLTKIYVITSHGTPFKANANIHIIKSPEIVQPKNRKIGAVARLLWLNIVLPRILKKNQFDVLLNLTHHGIFFPAIPQIITIHDLIPLLFPSQYRFQNYYFRIFLPRLLRRAVAISTCSECTKRDISRRYNVSQKKIIVTGNSFNSLLKPGTEDSKRKKDYILMVGAVLGHKNLHSVIKAYGQSTRLQAYTLKIVGEGGKYINYLKALAASFNVHAKVEFIGYATTECLSELYRNALVFVYPSFYEGFGMPPLEAMQMGTPVAASKIEPIQEVCEDAVFYFNPNSVEDIRKKLELISQNEELRDELIKKGFEQLKKHTWSNVSKRIYDILCSLPGNTKQP